MNRYKNTKTGATIEINGILSGKNWVKVENAATAKKTTKKKTAKTATE